VAAGSAGLDALILRLGAVIVRLAAAGATAVKLDAVAGAGDAVALAGAGRGDGRARAAGRGRGEGWDIGALGVVIRVGLVVDGLLGKAGIEGLKGSLLVLSGDDLLGLAGALGLWAADGRWAEGATLREGTALTAGFALGGTGSWDIEGVELAAGGGLGGEFTAGVVGDLIAIEHVVEPVALAWGENRGLEAEGTAPGA